MFQTNKNTSKKIIQIKRRGGNCSERKNTHQPSKPENNAVSNPIFKLKEEGPVLFTCNAKS